MKGCLNPPVSQKSSFERHIHLLKINAPKSTKYSRKRPSLFHEQEDTDLADNDDEFYDDEDGEFDGDEDLRSSYSTEYYTIGGTRFRRQSGASGSSSFLTNLGTHVGNNQGTSGVTLTGMGVSGDSSKRDHHNRLERKRRASIKDCFHELRTVLPDVMGGKPSRATILQRAAQELAYLKKDNAQRLRDINTYKMEIDDLNAKSGELQRTLETIYSRLPYNETVRGIDDFSTTLADAELDEREIQASAEDGSYSSGPSEAYM